MDEIRSCYRSTMQLVPGDPSSRIPVIWYFAAPGAKVMPGPHAFGSANWDYYRDEIVAIGEKRFDPGTWSSGKNVWGYTGVCNVGTPEEWAHGLTAETFAARLNQPLPRCCLPPLLFGQGGELDDGTQLAGGVYYIVGSGGQAQGGTAPATFVGGGTGTGGEADGGEGTTVRGFVAPRGQSMFVLDTTTRSLQSLLATTPTTELSVVVSFDQIGSGSTLPASAVSDSNGATPVTIAGPPGALVAYAIRTLNVRNPNSGAVFATVRYNDNGTLYPLWSGNIGGGRTLAYDEGVGWSPDSEVNPDGEVGMEPGTYGDGSDGALTYDGVATVLGVVPVANVYALTRSVYATNLTVNAGVTVNASGYKVYVKGRLTTDPTALLTFSPNAGSAGGAGGLAAGGSVGAGGGALTPQETGGGGAGTAGGAGAVSGTAGSGTAISTLNFTGGLGGVGGAGGAGTTGAAGSGGTAANTKYHPQRSLHSLPYLLSVTAANQSSGGSPGSGGGGGAGDLTNGGGGGGGGGSAGGVLAVFASAVVNNGTISAPGGAGGIGGAATLGNCGGGGGGAGGGGGWLFLVYDTYAGTGTVSAAGGAGGAGGAKTGTGVAGTVGASGATGVVLRYDGTARTFV